MIRSDAPLANVSGRFGMTYGQLAACACAILSGTRSLGASGSLVTLEAILDDDAQASRNFLSACREDPDGPVADALAGLTYSPNSGKVNKDVSLLWRDFRQEMIELNTNGG